MSYYVASTPSQHYRTRTLSHSSYQPAYTPSYSGGSYYPGTPAAGYSYPVASVASQPSYYVAASPSHHHRHHSSRRHRSHSTSSHRHGHGHHHRSHSTHSHGHYGSGYHNGYSTYHHQYPTIGDRIKNFFGFGHDYNHRYMDARTGVETDRHGRPIVRY